MKRQLLTILTVSIGLLIGGCYPEGPEYVEDVDVVLTNYDPNFDFVSIGTYAMPDSIVKITGNLQEGDTPEFIKLIYATPILAKIEANMANLGWTRVAYNANPDLLLLPAAWETTTIWYYYDYWYWWYGGYYPGWGYPGYYPPVYVSSYTTGTLVMTLADAKNSSTDGNPIITWTGAINGLLTGSYDANRINKAIDQSFTQSPYLTTN